MPNWCANRLRLTGLAENVSQVRALMRGEVRPLYARAEGEGSGCDFCGYDAYADGLLTDSMSSSLEWGEEDEDGYACVTGPDWIVNNVGHYGG